MVDGVAQPEDRLAHVLVGLGADVGQGLDLGDDPVVGEGADAGLEGTQPQVHGAEHLGEAVVHLAGDAGALAEHRPLPGPLAHLGTAEGDAGQAGEGARGSRGRGR